MRRRDFLKKAGEVGVLGSLPLLLGQSCFDVAADVGSGISEQYFYDYPTGPEPSIPRVSAGDFAFKADGSELDRNISGNSINNLLGDNDNIAVLKFPVDLIAHFTNERSKKGYNCIYIGGELATNTLVNVTVWSARYGIVYAKEDLILGKYNKTELLGGGAFTSDTRTTANGEIIEKNEIGIPLDGVHYVRNKMDYGEIIYINGELWTSRSTSARWKIRSVRAGIMPD